ncbi:MAG TPA: NAD(P)H-hydrate dehydratase [Pyrinomonadaceae bacterium]|nr:NAD(P)H-hydrate dehydratase [Pyrinomonadaceae bacterium]
MQPVLSASQMREVDRLTVTSYNTPSLLLMEAAANACLQAIEQHFNGALTGKKALVLCGKGNNGGDGAALARGLSRSGVHCDVVLCGTIADTAGDAHTNFEATSRLASFEAGSASIPAPLTFVECADAAAWEEIAPSRKTYDLIVDGLFGTGLVRPLEGLPLKVVEHLALLRGARDRAAGARPLIVSIDIPSGLNADSTTPIGAAVEADLTVTFTAPKPANVLPPASHWCGELIVADIGSPRSLLESLQPDLFVTEAEDARQWLISTNYKPESHKNTHGHVLIVAGSRGFTGAAALCGNAAMRSGAGLVTIATPSSVQDTVATHVMPEVMTMPLAETDRGAISDESIDHLLKQAKKSSVVAVGPGLTSADERTRQFVRAIVERRSKPTIVDADGLNCLSPWPSALQGSEKSPLILTPHPGEMRRLLGKDSLANDHVTVARNFATANKLILVLKGSRSLVASPDGRVFITPTGNPGLGTAGSGDTLTGLIAGFVAQAYATLTTTADPLVATLAALYIGGLAGDLAARDLGMRTMVASDIRERFGAAIRLLDPHGEQPRRSV